MWFTLVFEHGDYTFYDERGKNYKAYHCFTCKQLQPHEYIQDSDYVDGTVIYKCMMCARRKSIYSSTKKLPERSMM